MCTCDVGDGPSCYWEEWRTARTQHKCCECGSTIDRGERYRRVSGVWDGDFRSYKQCEFCAKKFDEANVDGFKNGYCICFEELWETVGM